MKKIENWIFIVKKEDLISANCNLFWGNVDIINKENGTFSLRFEDVETYIYFMKKITRSVQRMKSGVEYQKLLKKKKQQEELRKIPKLFD